MSDNLLFLKSLWTVFRVNPHLLSNHPQAVPSIWVNNWVDEKVSRRLGEYTSIDELASLCETEGVTNESFDKTIKNLNKDWAKLETRVKDALIKSLSLNLTFSPTDDSAGKVKHGQEVSFLFLPLDQQPPKPVQP